MCPTIIVSVDKTKSQKMKGKAKVLDKSVEFLKNKKPWVS
jgi:hypothetical protein